MAQNDKTEYRELRVPRGYCPEDVHLRVERWMEIHLGKTGEYLNKAEAVVALLDKATKHIKIPNRSVAA